MRPALPMRLPRSLAWLSPYCRWLDSGDSRRRAALPRKAVKSAKSASAAAKSDSSRSRPADGISEAARRKPLRRPPPRSNLFRLSHVEFADADSCNAFHADGVWVLTRFDRFLDVIIKKTDDAAHNALDNAAGLVWYDIAMGNVPTPPPVQLASTAEVTRAAPEGIVRGGIGSLTGRGVIDRRSRSIRGSTSAIRISITQDASGQPVSRVQLCCGTRSGCAARATRSARPRR